jgi:hypothetical protein
VVNLDPDNMVRIHHILVSNALTTTNLDNIRIIPIVKSRGHPKLDFKLVTTAVKTRYYVLNFNWYSVS